MDNVDMQRLASLFDARWLGGLYCIYGYYQVVLQDLLHFGSMQLREFLKGQIVGKGFIFLWVVGKLSYALVCLVFPFTTYRFSRFQVDNKTYRLMRDFLWGCANGEGNHLVKWELVSMLKEEVQLASKYKALGY